MISCLTSNSLKWYDAAESKITYINQSFVLWNCQMSIVTGHTHPLNRFSMWNQISQLAELNKQTAVSHVLSTYNVVVFWGSSPAPLERAKYTCALSSDWLSPHESERSDWSRNGRAGPAPGAAFRAPRPSPPEWVSKSCYRPCLSEVSCDKVISPSCY